MTNKLAFYYDSAITIPSDSTIQNIKSYLSTQNTYTDFVIFTNIMYVHNIQDGWLSTFYYRFFNGTIVFFDIDDYISEGQANNINLLYVDNTEKLNDIKKHYIKPNLLLHDDTAQTKYRIIYTNELQQTL